MTLELRSRSLGETTEHYLTARPGPGGAASLFLEIADELRAREARILLERIFVGGEDLARLEGIRRRAYGELDDGVTPTWLGSPDGRSGLLAGVLIHAIAGDALPTSVGRHLRALHHARGRLLTISGLCASGEGGFEERTCALLSEACALLRGQGASGLERVARTWLWVDRIGEHYGALNRGRTRCYREAELILEEAVPRQLPASTGIGLRPWASVLCLEAIATIEGAPPRTWPGGGNQDPALAYGSAFSRAAAIEGPTGPTLFVSGTAAIGRDGATVAPGESEAQIAATLANLRALLDDLELDESAIAQGAAYVQSEAVAEAWRRVAPAFPCCVVLADICRPELRFELEVTLCPGALLLAPMPIR